jgi:hypothetical protein
MGLPPLGFPAFGLAFVLFAFGLFCICYLFLLPFTLALQEASHRATASLHFASGIALRAH